MALLAGAAVFDLFDRHPTWYLPGASLVMAGLMLVGASFLIATAKQIRRLSSRTH